MFLFFPGCQSPNKAVSGVLGVKKLSVIKPLKIRIIGVECRLCAQEIERTFSSNSNYFGVRYIQSLGSYEDGYLQLQLTRGGCNFNLRSIKETLGQKDFLLGSIEGEAIGIFTEVEDTRVFRMLDHNETFLVSDERDIYRPISDEYWHQLEHNKEKRVYVKIMCNNNDWWLSL